MKKSLRLVTIVLATTFMLCACEDDKNYATLSQTYGEITDVATDGQYTILSDLNNTLVAINSVKPSFELEKGQRVYAQIGIENDNGTEKLVNVYYITKILTKAPIYFSEMTAAEQEEVGNTPIDVVDAWFSCGKYLNIKFAVLRNDSDTSHFINLKVDEENSTAERVVVEFRHNDYNETRLYRAYGLVSFDISKLVPAGQDSVMIEIHWTDYNDTPTSVDGKFSLTESAEHTICHSGEVITSDTYTNKDK